MGLADRLFGWLLKRAEPLAPKPRPLYSGENDRFDPPAAEAPRVYRSPQPERRQQFVSRGVSPSQDDNLFRDVPLIAVLAQPTYSAQPSCDTSSASYDSGPSSCDSGGSGW